MGDPIVCGSPWNGRSTVGGCVRDACVREAHGCASQRGVPSLQMNMCFDCHTIEPGSCVQVWYLVGPGSRPGGLTAFSLYYTNIKPNGYRGELQ